MPIFSASPEAEAEPEDASLWEEPEVPPQAARERAMAPASNVPRIRFAFIIDSPFP